jgi:hypothetical protein
VNDGIKMYFEELLEEVLDIWWRKHEEEDYHSE